MAFTFRPPTFYTLPPDQLGLELDRSLPRLYDSHSALDGIAIKAPALNGTFSFQSGVVTVTGSKTAIPTGLATVTVVTASINNGATATNFTVTARPTPSVPGSIDLYVWQPTSSSVTTPIACTTAVSVHWTASGSGAST